MALRDSDIRATKPADKSYRLTDQNNIYLLVQSTGAKLWRMDYTFNGKRKTLAIGCYPEVTLSMARKIGFDAKEQIKEGIDPTAVKQGQKIILSDDTSLKFVATEWLEKKCQDNSERPVRQLKFILPWLGNLPMNDIKAMDILKRLTVVQEKGSVYMATKALQMYGQIWRYAVATGRAERDVTQDLKGALETPKKRHFSAITETKDISGLLQSIHGYHGTAYRVMCATAFKLTLSASGRNQGDEMGGYWLGP